MDKTDRTDRKFVGIECKFVHYIPSDPDKGRDDMHYAKEIIHYSNGEKEINFRHYKDYQRPFWITREDKRNHKQKKESEYMYNLVQYKSTQSDLAKNVAIRLGMNRPKVTMRDVSRSPYLYGTDVDSKTHLKYQYTKKYPDLSSQNNVCTLDIEYNIDTEEIVLITVAMNNKIYTTVLKKILNSSLDINNRLLNLFKANIPDDVDFNKLKIEYDILDKETDVIINAVNKLHEWKPDIVAIWNIVTDIPYMCKRLEHFKIDPKDVFSDPSVPPRNRYFKFKEGSVGRVSESGVSKGGQVQERWHNVICPATFWFIDAMCAYHFIRSGGHKVPGGYSLDNILNHVLGNKYKKMKFNIPETENLSKEEWHKFMLNKRPLEYIIYNQWDSYSMLILDNKTKDLSTSISVLGRLASMDIFNSGPKKIISNLHFFYLENDRVLGTRDPNMVNDKLLGLDEWIVMLQAHRIVDRFDNLVSDCAGIPVNCRGMVWDLDQVSGYPSDGLAANISKDTTMKEVLAVGDFTITEFTEANINIIFGCVNSSKYMQDMCNFPSFEELV